MPRQWSRIPLAGRLALAFGLIALVALLEAVVVSGSMRTVTTTMETIESRSFPQVRRIADLEVQVLRASLESRHALLERSVDQREAALARVAAHRRQAEQLIGDIEQALSTDEGRRRLAQVRLAAEAFWQAAGRFDAAARTDSREAAFDLLVSDRVPRRDAFLAAIEHQLDWQRQLLASTKQRALGATRLAGSLAIGIGLFTLVIVLGFAAFFARHLRRQLGGEPHEAVTAVQAIAAGDLGRAVPVRPGDRHSVMAALADMRLQLTGLVGQVREGVDGVATASGQIAAGSLDLSGRTERQAAELQRTSGTMQGLTETIQRAAEHAVQAETLAGRTRDAAQAGGEAMARVVSTMDEIASSSQRITDITGLIDAISFQTNILALNAAVEAARAGDAGRGFAVVATEVRALAQRSADASREIRQLIGTSADKVQLGQSLVVDAGERMEGLVEEVRRVSSMIAEISAAGREQSRGIAEMATTVLDIDRGTQQNAALVEQTAAAAESLKAQAGQLARSVAVFRTATVAA